MSLTLADFLAGPGGRIVRSLKLPADQVATCTTWPQLTAVAVRHNDRTDGGVWDRGKELFGVMSTGERAVLLALLAALDFARLADELASEAGTWTLLDYTTGPHRDAVAACISRRDR